MKKTMLWVVMAVIAIMLMVAFDLSLSPTEPIVLADNIAPNALFVCPVSTDSVWVDISNGLNQVRTWVVIGLLFAVFLLIAIWSWALYQNLLKDKFDRASFKGPWGYTKFLFWAIIVVVMLMKTPDSYRLVEISGARGNWVLCDNNTPGAHAAPISKIHYKKH